MLKNVRVCLSLLALIVACADPAHAMDCATQADTAALKTAMMQQELMVAALQCREAGAYNRFVINYRTELQASDATLKAFFARRGGKFGEAGYDTFKTKAANLSALHQARDSRSFCADAHGLLTAALAHKGSLTSFVEKRTARVNIGNMCVEPRSAPIVVARAEGKAAPVKVAAARIPDAGVDVPVYDRPAIPYGRAATVMAMTDKAVGVPEYNRPPIPYRDEVAAPPANAMTRYDDREDEDFAPDDAAADREELLPPPPRRYFPSRNRYPQRDYYPAPAYSQRDWQPYPRYYGAVPYGWYPRERY